MILSALSLLFAQAGAVWTLEQDRLVTCQAEARRDPTSAIATASAWLKEATGEGRSAPQQCLGFAYVSLLRWQAAEQAFAASREALPMSAFAQRARLAAMAGNAALAESRFAEARAHFDLAQADAAASGDMGLSGEIAADRARALVGLGRPDEAAAALEIARRDAPQDVQSWLLSATLARRQNRLAEAQAAIETAAALAPGNAAVGLEAGVIAALAGRDDAARESWRSVIAASPNSGEAAAARGYLEQVGAPAQASGR